MLVILSLFKITVKQLPVKASISHSSLHSDDHPAENEEDHDPGEGGDHLVQADHVLV